MGTRFGDNMWYRKQEGAGVPSVGWPEIIPVPDEMMSLLVTFQNCAQGPAPTPFGQGQGSAFQMASEWLAEEIIILVWNPYWIAMVRSRQRSV